MEYESDEGEDAAADAAADALLADLKRLRADLADSVSGVDGREAAAEAAAENMHASLYRSLAGVVSDVARGRPADEPEPDKPAAPPPPTQPEWSFLPPEAAVPIGAGASSGAAASACAPAEASADEPPASSASAKAQARSGRFKAPPTDREAKVLVSDISRLASKPLLSDELPPMPRARGAVRGPAGRGPPGRVGAVGK